jgi:hypothetical protein
MLHLILAALVIVIAANGGCPDCEHGDALAKKLEAFKPTPNGALSGSQRNVCRG